MTQEGKKKYEAIEREEQYSLFLDKTLDEKHITSTREATAIGKSDSHLSHYRNLTSERSYPAALIPMSHIKHEQMAFLAIECGGTYVADSGKLNGSTKDEQAKCLHALARMRADENREIEIEQWTIIEKAAAKALKELRK